MAENGKKWQKMGCRGFLVENGFSRFLHHGHRGSQEDNGRNGRKWQKMVEKSSPRLFGRKWILALFTSFPYYFGIKTFNHLSNSNNEFCILYTIAIILIDYVIILFSNSIYFSQFNSRIKILIDLYILRKIYP